MKLLGKNDCAHPPFIETVSHSSFPLDRYYYGKSFINEQESFVIVDLYHYLELLLWAMHMVTFIQTISVALTNEKRCVKKRE